MAAPLNEVVQITYQNPHAKEALFLPVLVVCNTSDETLGRNVERNSSLDLPWIKAEPANDLKAILVGGGPSIENHVEDIREMQISGGVVFAMNGASEWLGRHGIIADHQCIADAKPETSTLVDKNAKSHLFASQVDPLTMDSVANPVVWHLELGNVEQYFPTERLNRGGYALIGGGAAVGNSALCLAYAMGFRDLHIFGFDSCHREGKSHAYSQTMNQFIPCVDVTWGGKTYTSSIAMKAQAEKFQMTAQALKGAGCTLHVYGEGLLQAMYLTPPKDLSEREKYILMWEMDSYRRVSPGEEAVGTFLDVMKPQGLIVDFGCGTGRAALALKAAGHDVYLVDFAGNCRDQEALFLPFLEWDLNHPCPVRAKFGICTDMMEHIPTADVEVVIRNIMASAENVFFQISTVTDQLGVLIGSPLHLTVKSHDWWLSLFGYLGYRVKWAKNIGIASQFAVQRDGRDQSF